MRRRGRGGVFLVVALGIAVAARAAPKQTGPHADKRGIPAARRIEAQIPKSIELRVGQKRSFRGVNAASLLDGEVAQLSVDAHVLTVRGAKPGTTRLFLFSSAPPGSSVQVRPEPIDLSVRPL